MLGSGHATSLLRWRRHLPQLREVLQKAEFVSLDLEMTGMRLLSSRRGGRSYSASKGAHSASASAQGGAAVKLKCFSLAGLHARSEKFLGVDRCYVAHAAGARGFMPVQLGLCAARRSGTT